MWGLLAKVWLRHKYHSSDKYLHYPNVAIIDTSRRDRELDAPLTSLGNTDMSAILKSIRCNLIIEEQSVSAMEKHYDRNNINETARGVQFACLTMLKNYNKSSHTTMALEFSQIHNISQALEHKIGEYLQGRFEPEIKEISLRFKDNKGLDQRIGFTLKKQYI